MIRQFFLKNIRRIILILFLQVQLPEDPMYSVRTLSRQPALRSYRTGKSLFQEPFLPPALFLPSCLILLIPLRRINNDRN